MDSTQTPIRNIDTKISERELALLTIIRKLGHGTLETISVRCGDPTVVMISRQRLDLDREEERVSAIKTGSGLVDVETVPKPHSKTVKKTP